MTPRSHYAIALDWIIIWGCLGFMTYLVLLMTGAD